MNPKFREAKEELIMKIGKKNVSVFKIMNRRGYAAVCAGHLTEGRSSAQAVDRMTKALKRTDNRKARKAAAKRK